MEITEQQWQAFKGFMEDADAEKHKTRRRGRGKAQKAPGAILGYNTNRYPGSFVTDELHHAVPLARMMPLFRTIRNKEQLKQLLSALESRGIRLGDSFENTFAIDKRFHDSADPRSIHRIEQGMENPERYVPMGATFEEALGAVDDIAQDATSSKKRIREIQFRETQVGDMSRFEEMVLAPTEQTLSPQERRAIFRESKAKDLGGKNPFAKNVNIVPEQQSVVHARDVYARQQNVRGNPGLVNLEYRNGTVQTRYFPNRLVRSVSRLAPGVGIATGLTVMGEKVMAGDLQGAAGEGIAAAVGEVPIVGDVLVMAAEGTAAGAGSDITDPAQRQAYLKQREEENKFDPLEMALTAGQAALDNPMLTPVTLPIKVINGAAKLFGF